MIIIDENIEETGYLKVKMFKKYWVQDGTVFIYDVTPIRVKGGIHIESFFLCTFDNMSDEVAYGMGPSVVEALKNAMEQWVKSTGEDLCNPFREALNKFRRDV